MSNHLAVATVTAALRQVVADAVHDVVSGAEVTHVRPGGSPAQTPALGVNVFLYGVTPNSSLRNADLPTRRADGTPSQKPAAALDLHYLLSFYGDDRSLETQRLLGSVVRALHGRPALSRSVLRDVVDATAVLGGSDLPDAVETVRFTPVNLSLEELSKLWSVLFQTQYALSVAYTGTAVLIQADETARPALPVTRRNVYVGLLGGITLERLEPAGPVTTAGTLVIHGRNLRGERTRVRIGDQEAEPQELSPTSIRVPLSAFPAGTLLAGMRPLRVVHLREMGTPPFPRVVDESNALPLVIAPTVEAVSHDPAGPAVVATLAPKVAREQGVTLLLNGIGGAHPSFAFAARPRAGDATAVVFDTPGLPAGEYLARVRVDGAESALAQDADGAFTGPTVTVP